MLTIGILAGKVSLRRIRAVCEKNMEKIRRYMPLKNGIPSISTMSRMLSSIDTELLCLSFMTWVGTYLDTRGRDIAIDGKGLRAGTRKIRGEKTPYILNAMDTETKLVVGQWPINEKTNEAGALPEFLEMMQLDGSTVTIDAIGTTGNIMEKLHQVGAHFVLQVKKNCPALYKEIMDLFEGLEEEKKEDAEAFQKKYGEFCSEYKPGLEVNRERKEYRRVMEYHEPEGIKAFQEERPYIKCVGKSWQVRVEKIVDSEGNDVTPCLKEFLKKGSEKQPLPKEGDGMNDTIQCAGIISDTVLSAEELARIKRRHWLIEGSLHGVLDGAMGEDKSKVKNGREALSVLRKCAYNIARILQRIKYNTEKLMVDIFDEITEDLSLGMKYLFKSVPLIK